MKKKTTITVLAIFIVAAIFLGLLLVNKGDGPVMGMMLADKAMADTQSYNDSAQAQGDDVYLVLSNAFNKYQEDYKADIPKGDDLYAAVYFVECPQGSEYSCKWIKDDTTIKEETGVLKTGPQGVISYMLDGEKVEQGIYIFELYNGDSKIFERTFSVE
ncbi:MAG: hypothetical protein AB1Z23_12660 [Eubacteriales bacterium]